MQESPLTSMFFLSSVHFVIMALAVFYTVLLIIEMYLMIRFSRLGPSSLHTGKYHFEKLNAKQAVQEAQS